MPANGRWDLTRLLKSYFFTIFHNIKHSVCLSHNGNLNFIIIFRLNGSYFSIFYYSVFKIERRGVFL